MTGPDYDYDYDHVLAILREIRNEQLAMRRRMDFEFAEVLEWLRRVNEHFEGERLENAQK